MTWTCRVIGHKFYYTAGRTLHIMPYCVRCGKAPEVEAE